MTDERKSMKVAPDVAARFEDWQRKKESQSDALKRLLDLADAVDVVRTFVNKPDPEEAARFADKYLAEAK